MKIAVVGAGFAGLACAWYLLKMSHEVVLFDSKGIGAGASGIAAGLLHPFASQKAALSWQAQAAISETLKLVDVASQAIGVPIAHCTGMLRPAISEDLKIQLLKTAASYPDTEWWESPLTKNHLSQLLDLFLDMGGLFIQSGVTIASHLYLEGLWKACTQMGATLEIASISSSDDLKHFDAIIFAVGAGFNSLKEVTHPPITLIKGQILELAWPQDLPQLPFAINAKGYLAMAQKDHCIAGATYERKWQHQMPDLASCEAHIRGNIAQFSPALSALPLIECRASIRAATQNKLPFICKSGPNSWCLGGMGSKGLLYHAFMAKQLCTELLHHGHE